MPCWRGRRGRSVIIHAVSVTELLKVIDGGRLSKCRALCGRRDLRFVTYFSHDTDPEVCAFCRALVPGLAPPEPGAIYQREIQRVSSIRLHNASSAGGNDGSDHG